MRFFFRVLNAVLVTMIVALFTYAQNHSNSQAQTACMSDTEVKAAFGKFDALSKMPPNQKLRETLIKEWQEYRQKIFGGPFFRPETSQEKIAKYKAKVETKLCALLNQHGWFTTRTVGRDGSAVALSLIENTFTYQNQLLLWPIMEEAVKRTELEKADLLASFIDHLRVKSGHKQMFGTQAYVEGDFIVLYPLENEAMVSTWRNEYGMNSLAAGIKGLEARYSRPLIRAPATKDAPQTWARKVFNREKTGAIVDSGGSDPEEVITIKSNLVNLNVVVMDGAQRITDQSFEQADFRVFEDGKEEAITFFGKTSVNFDLVLLLDVSGSTADKMGLIRKSTARFINATRPGDRVAILTFADQVQVVSPFTGDRASLLKSVEKLKGDGSSNVWEALRYTLEEFIGQRPSDRRRAIVFMTDGIDNSLAGRGAGINFADLLETVRHSDAMVVPIYIEPDNSMREFLKTMTDSARATLQKLAGESGGLYYKARKLDDLDGVYGEVLNDLARTYSIGYVPTNDAPGGFWRSVKVELNGKPGLVVKTRSGYYAK